MLSIPKRRLIAARGGVPEWVLEAVSRRFGATPDVFVQFDKGRGWQRGVGEGPPERFVACSCNSTRYRDDLAGNWRSIGANLLAYSDKGLRAWEGRTQSVRVDSMSGAVAGVIGSGGSLPTNWSIGGAAGLTKSVIGTGTSLGADYIDIRLNGTTSGMYASIYFDTATGIAGLTGQTWTLSALAAVVGGSPTNVTFVRNVLDENSNVPANIRQDFGTNYVSFLTSSLQRFSDVFTTSGGASVAFLDPQVQLNWSSGVAIDITLRIAWPQLELGAMASPPKRSTGSAVSESAEVYTLINMPALGSGYTVHAAGVPAAPTGYANTQFLASLPLDDNTRLTLDRVSSTGNVRAVSRVGGVQTNLQGAVWSQGAAGKIAASDASGAQAASFNGGSILTGAGALPTGLTACVIGSDGTTRFFDGDVTEFALWPRDALPSAALQAGTT